MPRRLDFKDLPEWLTVRQTAKLLGLPATTLAEWIAAKRLPAPRDLNARVVRYPRDMVEAISILLEYGWLPLPDAPREEK